MLLCGYHFRDCTNCFRADGHDKGSAHDITQNKRIQIPALYLQTAGIHVVILYFHPGTRSIGKLVFISFLIFLSSTFLCQLKTRQADCSSCAKKMYSKDINHIKGAHSLKWKAHDAVLPWSLSVNFFWARTDFCCQNVIDFSELYIEILSSGTWFRSDYIWHLKGKKINGFYTRFWKLNGPHHYAYIFFGDEIFLKITCGS